MCPDVVFESDQTLQIFKITDNNIKILKSSDKANGFEGNAFIPDEVRLLLQERMPTQYGIDTDAMGHSQTHSVPDQSIQSKHKSATSVVSQKIIVVKSKRLARSDVSERQSGSKGFSAKPHSKTMIQGGE